MQVLETWSKHCFELALRLACRQSSLRPNVCPHVWISEEASGISKVVFHLFSCLGILLGLDVHMFSRLPACPPVTVQTGDYFPFVIVDLFS